MPHAGGERAGLAQVRARGGHLVHHKMAGDGAGGLGLTSNAFDRFDALNHELDDVLAGHPGHGTLKSFMGLGARGRGDGTSSPGIEVEVKRVGGAALG
jgi:hypothetical protein